MLLPLLWAACAIAAYLYSAQQNIPIRTALAVLPAFLLEVTFFYALAVDRVRARVEKLPSVAFALALTGAALAPYTAATWALGSFHWRAFFYIGILAAAVSFWYVLLPRTPASDVVFLVFMAVVWLSRILHQYYADPHPKLQLEVLGQLMWFRTGIFAMVSIRRPPNVGFGFWPQKRHWQIGLVYYLIFLPVAAALAWWIKFAKPHWPTAPWERTSFMAVATFFGVLWVLALGEEFFFRGLLQQWMIRWLGNDWAGLAAASLIFGSAHLWFGHAFPNWRMAAMATLLGICCGLAFRRARSIRASMVTHALVVTTWRLFFF
jgi:membrane protease YdiL (CAAX protease family)